MIVAPHAAVSWDGEGRLRGRVQPLILPSHRTISSHFITWYLYNVIPVLRATNSCYLSIFTILLFVSAWSIGPRPAPEKIGVSLSTITSHK